MMHRRRADDDLAQARPKRRACSECRGEDLAGALVIVDLRLVRWAVLGIIVLALLLGLPARGWADASSDWDVMSIAPTTVAPGSAFDYTVSVFNNGPVATDGSPYTLNVTLPAGLTAVGVINPNGAAWDCGTPAGQSFSCTNSDVLPIIGSLDAQPPTTIRLSVAVDPSASGTLTSSFEVSGGGLSGTATTVDPTEISATPRGFGIDAVDEAVTAKDGSPFTQAGGHPYGAKVSIGFNSVNKPVPVTTPFGGTSLLPTAWPVEPVKDVMTDLPPGLVGNPQAVDRCKATDLAGSASTPPACPTGAQVGVALVRVASVADQPYRPVPVYNMVPPADVPARFGMNILGTIVTLDGQVRSDGDYGLSVNAKNTSEGVALLGIDVTFWGVPADPSHDAMRACPNQVPPTAISGGPVCSTQAPLTPFLTLPTTCSAPNTGLLTTVRVDSWTHPGVFASRSIRSHLPPGYPNPPEMQGAQQGTTGCEKLPFDPTFKATPLDSTSPGPSGYAFDLQMPANNDDPNRPAEAHLKKAVVTLPKGVRVSPSSAHGLGGCSSAQIALHSTGDANCPDSSKIGTLTLDTPLLAEPLEGAVYLATPHDNPSHSLLAVYLVAKGPGVIIKLSGSVQSGAGGQLSATFDNNPQLPFTSLHLEFFGGPHAALSNPPTCGTYETNAVMTSWSGKTVTSTSDFTTSADGHGKPCAAPRFAPELTAGTINPVAGASSPFVLTISRSDQDQELKAITSVKTPKGLLAHIADVPLCPGALAPKGACPRRSRIGSVVASAGPGPDPFAVSGTVYLGGRYKGAPFSLISVVPVVAGPFDLGKVTLRSAINVSPSTAALKIVTDPLPTELQGIPLQIRMISVLIDRPKFMLNPTSCTPKRIAVGVLSTQGRSAHLTSHFQVGNCADLPLAPKLTLTIGGKGHIHRHTSTPFTATLTQTRGQSALKGVSVRLPSTLQAHLEVVSNACTQAEFDSGHCEKAKAGNAVAVTPLLKHALRGGAYFVTDPNQPAGSLPNLVIALRGQVSFNLVSKVKIPGGTLLATRFDSVPDVPISRFTLHLMAGSHGPLGAAVNLCSPAARRATASVGFTGQNGDALHVDQHLRVRGCPRAKHR
jgi:hypothetical protein